MTQKRVLPEEVQERISKDAERSLERVLINAEGKLLPEKVEDLKEAYINLFISKETKTQSDRTDNTSVLDQDYHHHSLLWHARRYQEQQ